MVHEHPVTDSDKHFIIDPITRAVTNAESKKNLLMQNDHNSERFTFEIDRYVEGHDMKLCNRVEVHYSNVDSNKTSSNLGVYEVDDVSLNSDETKIVFSWLVSENATLYSGSLNFLVLFACVENGETVYRWNSAINNSITIAKGMYNGDEIAELYPDILSQWKEELFAAVYGYKVVAIGPSAPDTYPYIWFNNSEYGDSGLGIITVKDADGIVYSLYPVTKMDAVEGLNEALAAINTAIDNNELSITELEEAVSELQTTLNNIGNTITPESIGAATEDHTHNDLTSVGERYTISVEPDTADKSAGMIRIKDNASGDTRALIAANEDTSLGETSQISLRNSTNTGRVNIQSTDFGKKGLRIIDENGFTRVDISHNVNGDACTFQINDASGNDITLDTIGAQKKRLTFEDITIATSAWEEDSYHQYEDYPYQTAIPASGVDSTMYAEVVFGVTEATSGNYAPICAPQSDVVWIYAKAIPDSDITIKSVVVWR